jgi:DnaJ family protein C protein 9
MEHVPFMGVEDEPRFHEIVDEWIKSGEVDAYKTFTNEPKAKRDRRHKKYAREARENEEMKEEKNNENDNLSKIIAKRQQDRGNSFGSFLDKLAAKYTDLDDEDDDDEVDLKEISIRMKGKKRASTSKSAKKETPIKSGRVTKKKK